MANAITGFNLQGIKNSAVVDVTVSTLRETFRKLSDGLKVQQGRDETSTLDEGSLSVSDLANQFTANLQSLNRATLDTNDGIAMVHVMDAGLGDIQTGLEQLQDLAARGTDHPLSDQDRQALQTQAQQIQERIGHIVQQTRYNDISVLAANKNIHLQTDAAADSQTTLTLRDFSNLFAPVDVRNSAEAEAALSFLRENKEIVYTARTQLAVQETSLVRSSGTLENVATHMTGTGTRIQSADLAQAIANAAAATIRAYPGMALQTQANQTSAKVQSLL